MASVLDGVGNVLDLPVLGRSPGQRALPPGPGHPVAAPPSWRLTGIGPGAHSGRLAVRMPGPTVMPAELLLVISMRIVVPSISVTLPVTVVVSPT